ncbi:hypothetical protein C8F01DRAFT_1084327 [Mycena amicta]|nr:hypothetical protein C8F01DRAFT_1084327 [Mycena amicta]
MSLLPTFHLGFVVTAVFSIWILNMVREEYRCRRTISKIPGPPSPSWLFGESRTLHKTPNSSLRSDQIENAPALHAFITWLLSEAGVSTRRGQDHRQLQAALSVGFTPEAMRNYRPLFEGVAQRVDKLFTPGGQMLMLIAQISEKLGAATSSSEESTIVDMVPLLNTATLSTISEGVSSILAKQSKRNHRAAALGCPVEELSADLIRTNGEVIFRALSSTMAPGQLASPPGRQASWKGVQNTPRSNDEASDVYTRVLHDSILVKSSCGNWQTTSLLSPGTATKAQIRLDDLVRQTSTMMLAVLFEFID